MNHLGSMNHGMHGFEAGDQSRGCELRAGGDGVYDVSGTWDSGNAAWSRSEGLLGLPDDRGSGRACASGLVPPGRRGWQEYRARAQAAVAPFAQGNTRRRLDMRPNRCADVDRTWRGLQHRLDVGNRNTMPGLLVHQSAGADPANEHRLRWEIRAAGQCDGGCALHGRTERILPGANTGDGELK